MNLEGWNQEVILISESKFAFQFFATPHNELVLISYGKKRTEICVYHKPFLASSWKDDRVRKDAFLSLLSSLENKNLESLMFYYDNGGNLIIIISTLTDHNEIPIYTLYRSISTNYGKSWEPPLNITADFQSWRCIHSPIFLKFGIQVGVLLVPVEDMFTKRGLVLHKDEKDEKWNFSLFLEPLECIHESNNESISEDIDDFTNQMTSSPALFETHKGNIISIFCTYPANQFVYAISKDQGYTWISKSCLDMKISPNYPIYIKKINTDENISINGYILGVEEMQHYDTLKLLTFNDILEHFFEKWTCNIFNKGDLLGFWLDVDFNQIIHVFYQLKSTPQEVHHYYIDELILSTKEE